MTKRKFPEDPLNEGALFMIFYKGQVLTPQINKELNKEHDPQGRHYSTYAVPPKRIYMKLSVARGALAKLPEFIRKHCTIVRFLQDKPV